MSRTADEKYRISANSLTEIQTAWDDATTVISRAAKDRDGYAIPAGHVLNGLVLWFLRLPPAEQERIALEGVAIYAKHLDSTVKLPVVPLVAGGDLPAIALGAKGGPGRPGGQRVDKSVGGVSPRRKRR